MKSINVLTRQEAIVLALIARGCRNSEIASELVISIKTVETHISRILGKLGVTSRTQAALYALENDPLTNPEIRDYPDATNASTNYA